MVAPPPAPLPILLDSDGDESDYEPKKTRGKKGGPSVSGHVQNANRVANMTMGPIPALLGAHFIDGEWERDNSFWEMLPWNFYMMHPPTRCIQVHWPLKSMSGTMTGITDHTPTTPKDG